MAEAAEQELGPEPSRAVLRNEALLAAVGILIALGLIKHLGAFLPFFADHGFSIAAGLQLYLPLLLIGRRGLSKRSLGLRLDTWRVDLKWLLIWGVLVSVPFALGHHVWQTVLFHRRFVPRLMPGLLEDAAIQLFVVGLAEELYFRGYLLERLERLWPAQRKLFGAPFGAAVITSAAVFALAHFVGEYRFDRLGPFFPALLFGLMRARSGSILGAITFHAYCNLLGDVLFACYRPAP